MDVREDGIATVEIPEGKNDEELFLYAEGLRKQGKYQQALKLLTDLWEKTHQPRAGAAGAHCLRKSGDFEEAEALARAAYEAYPYVTWGRMELIWSILQGRLRKAAQNGNERETTGCAEEIFNLTDEALPRKMAAFTVIDLCRRFSHWNLMLAWCDRLSRESLSVEKRDPADKRAGIPDRERWYFARIRALMNLERWDEVREECARAQADFPRRADFPRWAALALAEKGAVEDAVKELDRLIEKGRREWYIQADRADLHLKTGDLEKARRDAIKAALGYGEAKAKVNLFFLLARIYHRRGDDAKALLHLRLAREIRKNEGWSIPGELIQMQTELEKVCPPANPGFSESLDDMLRKCKSIWHESPASKDPVPAGKETGGVSDRRVEQESAHSRPEKAPQGRMQGVVLIINNNFGFLKPDGGGDNIFFLVQDMPKACRSVGMAVSFSLKANFDHKKGKESVKAVDIKEKA